MLFGMTCCVSAFSGSIRGATSSARFAYRSCDQNSRNERVAYNPVFKDRAEDIELLQFNLASSLDSDFVTDRRSVSVSATRPVRRGRLFTPSFFPVNHFFFGPLFFFSEPFGHPFDSSRPSVATGGEP